MFIPILFLSLYLFQSFSDVKCQLTKATIRSLDIPTKGVTKDKENFIYDGKRNTRGSFLAARSQYVDFNFDLGKNKQIAQVVVTMSNAKPDIRVFVGNKIGQKFEGALQFNCKAESQKYICSLGCLSGSVARNGTIARHLQLQIKLTSSWTVIYEVEVMVAKMDESTEITKNRVVLPENCDKKTWMLIESSSTMKTPVMKDTKIYLEKSYVIDKIRLSVQSSKQVNLAFQNKLGAETAVSIDLNNCQKAGNEYDCPINKRTLSTRVIIIKSDGVTKLIAKGKPAFLPSLDVIIDKTNSETLKLSCKTTFCDLAIHDDCSENYIKSGVKFNCINKRLLRLPAEGNKDPIVVVDFNKISDQWKETEFKVVSNDEEKMVVSMPRKYNYYGKYKCGCISSEGAGAAIESKSSNMEVKDFIQNLIIKSEYKYKEGDSDEVKFQNVINNLIVIFKEKQKESYLTMKLTVYSLLNNLNIKATIPTDEEATEDFNTNTGQLSVIKAFPKIPNSWNVKTFKYSIEDMYPEFIQNNGVKLEVTDKEKTKSQKEMVKFILIEKGGSVMPSVVKKSTNMKLSVDFVYTMDKELQLLMKSKGCKAEKETKLATFTNKKCQMKHDSVNCKIEGSANIISVKQERDMSSKYTFIINDKSRNTEVANVTSISQLTQKDVETKMELTELSKSTKEGFVKVGVQVTLKSKLISDYIGCGKVLGKIMIPGENKKELVLQNPTIIFNVDMNSNSVSITLEINIEGVKGTYKKTLTVINPVSLSVKNVKYEDKLQPVITWKGVEKSASGLVSSYKVVINSTEKPCSLTIPEVKMVKKESAIGPNRDMYKIKLPRIKKTYSSLLKVVISPVFKGSSEVTGKSKEIEKAYNHTGATMLTISDEVLPRERKVIVKPFQSDLSCEIAKATFELTRIETNTKEKTIKKLSTKNEYKLTELVPGRKYQLKAKVVYKDGSEDKFSKQMNFETADEVSVETTKHIAKSDEMVNIKCTAELGPNDEYKKQLEWKRADGAPLPAGIRSVSEPGKDNQAFLRIEKAHPDYTGSYGCFVRPKAEVGNKAIVQLFINNLELSKSEIKTQLKGQEVSVKCLTSNMDKSTELIWRTSSDKDIPRGDSKDYSVTMKEDPTSGYVLMLTIKNVDLQKTGKYKCVKKSKDGVLEKQTFVLLGEESLKITELSDSKPFLGEKSKFRCEGKAAYPGQKVEWITNNVEENGQPLMTTSYPNSDNKLIQDISVSNRFSIREISCKIGPTYKAGTTPVKTKQKIMLKSKIEVSGLKDKVNAGANVTLTCSGYPEKEGKTLVWLSNLEDKKGMVLKRTSVQKDLSKPMTLSLDLYSVTQNTTGKYNCKFDDESVVQTVNLLVQTKPLKGRKVAANLKSWSFVVLLLEMSVLFINQYIL